MMPEQGQTALRLRQGAERADRLDLPVPGRFLTGEERSLAVHMAREAGVLAALTAALQAME